MRIRNSRIFSFSFCFIIFFGLAVRLAATDIYPPKDQYGYFKSSKFTIDEKLNNVETYFFKPLAAELKKDFSQKSLMIDNEDDIEGAIRKVILKQLRAGNLGRILQYYRELLDFYSEYQSPDEKKSELFKTIANIIVDSCLGYVRDKKIAKSGATISRINMYYVHLKVLPQGWHGQIKFKEGDVPKIKAQITMAFENFDRQERSGNQISLFDIRQFEKYIKLLIRLSQNHFDNKFLLDTVLEFFGIRDFENTDEYNFTRCLEQICLEFMFKPTPKNLSFFSTLSGCVTKFEDSILNWIFYALEIDFKNFNNETVLRAKIENFIQKKQFEEMGWIYRNLKNFSNHSKMERHRNELIDAVTHMMAEVFLAKIENDEMNIDLTDDDRVNIARAIFHRPQFFANKLTNIEKIRYLNGAYLVLSKQTQKLSFQRLVLITLLGVIKENLSTDRLLEKIYDHSMLQKVLSISNKFLSCRSQRQDEVVWVLDDVIYLLEFWKLYWDSYSDFSPKQPTIDKDFYEFDGIKIIKEKFTKYYRYLSDHEFQLLSLPLGKQIDEDGIRRCPKYFIANLLYLYVAISQSSALDLEQKKKYDNRFKDILKGLEGRSGIVDGEIKKIINKFPSYDVSGKKRPRPDENVQEDLPEVKRNLTNNGGELHFNPELVSIINWVLQLNGQIPYKHMPNH